MQATEKSLRTPDFDEIEKTELAAGERKKIESVLAGSEDGPEFESTARRFRNGPRR